MSSTGESEDILTNMKFHNDLPPPPSGSFLKSVPLAENTNFFNYNKQSTLENNIIWQRHISPDMNIMSKTEDQDSLITDPTNRLRTTEKYFVEGALDKTKQQQKHENVAAHWWLRETKYGENQLFQNRNKNKIEKANDIQDVRDFTESTVINESFIEIEEFEDDDEVEWSQPILPDETFGEQQLSFTRFDEDPEEAETWEEKYPDIDGGDNATAVTEDKFGKQQVGKKRMCDSILTEIRSVKAGSNSYAVSMVVPPISGDKTKYQWARDYQMDLNTSLMNHYLLVANDTCATYHDVGSNIDVHRINIDSVVPHNCIVISP
jgi:hypothetical protein